MARTRGQSVLEILEEEDFFMSSRPAKRDHVDSIVRFRVRDRDWNAVQKTQGHEPLLSIVEAVIFVRDCRAIEYALGVCEVKPVIPEICASLPLIPREPH